MSIGVSILDLFDLIIKNTETLVLLLISFVPFLRGIFSMFLSDCHSCLQPNPSLVHLVPVVALLSIPLGLESCLPTPVVSPLTFASHLRLFHAQLQ